MAELAENNLCIDYCYEERIKKNLGDVVITFGFMNGKTGDFGVPCSEFYPVSE